VLVPVEGQTHCLVKGPVHGQQIHLQHGGAGSYVDVLGSDVALQMDREARTQLWAGSTDSEAVSAILGRHGLTADVEATAARHVEEKHALVQRDSDLRFVRRLARRNGFLFWVDANAEGVATGHFRRPRLDGEPACTLTLNLEAPSLGSLDISFDVERPTRVVGAQLDLRQKTVLDGAVDRTPLSPLGTTPLEAIGSGTRSTFMAAPSDDVGDLRARGEGALIEAGWFLRATCETSLHTLRKLVRAHTVVELQGVGTRHSGRYLCASVRHLIDETAHRMEVELVRNAWGTQG
jgi:hypothetical protein